MGVKTNNHNDSIIESDVGLSKPLGGGLELELLALEPRVLFDGAAVITGAEAIDVAGSGAEATQAASNDGSSDQQLLDALSGTVPSDNNRTELVFVDTAVEDYQTILASIGDNVEVVLIDSNGDGVEQIASVLSGRQDIDGIHIISHGRSGTLDLGTAKLTAASIAGRYVDELAIIADAMDENGDILIYGCNFGQYARGAGAVEALAEATGADVAASSDLTGAAALGGDWDLEVKSGSIEAKAAEAMAFSGVLAAPTIDLDVVSTPSVPGINDTISLDFSTPPVVSNDTQTEAVNGVGNGETAVYANVGTVNGQAIDLRAVVVSRTGPDVTFSTVGDDAAIQVPGTVGVLDNAVVRWEMVLTGTNTAITGDFTILFTDIDQSATFANRFERISVQESQIDG